MRKIIYTKYANDRAKEFAIRTDIVKDETGNKYVQKCFLDKSGENHVLKMLDTYKLLSELYSNYKTNVSPVPCRKIKSGVEFDFVHGESLDGIFKEYIVNKQKEELKKALLEYLELLSFSNEELTFESSPQFEEVFGKIGEEWTKERALSYANIDMIPANIIINDRWNIIDYEWVFDFKIPVKFVQYRCLHYWFHENKKNTLLLWNEILDLIQVTEEQQSVFNDMEAHFQGYLCKGITPTREMRDVIGQKIISINEINEKLLEMNPIQIYYDTGKDFNENESCKVEKANFMDNKIDFIWKIPVDIKAIRIDPIEKACVCNIQKIEINEKSIEYITNGAEISEGIYNFETNDPWIISYINASKGDILKVRMRIDYEKMTCKALKESQLKLINMEEKQIALQNEKMSIEQTNEVLHQEKAILEQKNKVLHQEKMAIEEVNEVLHQEKVAVEQENEVLNQRLQGLRLEYEKMTGDNEYLLEQFERSQMELADKMLKKQKLRNILHGKWFG